MSFPITPLGNLRPHYQAVVVGSGYGGGVAANRLARMGFSVAVLEKGKLWRPGDFGSRFWQIASKARLYSKRFALGRENNLFELHLGEDLNVMNGCGLGGGSLVNAGLAFRPRAAVFERAGWPREVREDGHLEAGFELAEKMLGVSHCPQGSEIDRYKALELCARELGASANLVPSTINYQPGANWANVLQPACTLCGDCWTGCNTGAKNTVLHTYLTDAAHQGASLFINLRVAYVLRDGDRWRIFYEVFDEESGRLRYKASLTADRVVLAAGVIGSTAILLRSREKGLAVSERLGKGISANGDDLAFGHDLPAIVNGISVGYPRRARTGPMGPNCIGMVSIEGERLEDDLSLQAGTMLAMMTKLSPLKALLRLKPLRSFKIFMDGPYKGVLRHTLAFYIVGHDSAAGELRLEGGRPRLHWPDFAGEPVFERARTSLIQTLTRLGANYMQNPFRDRLFGGRVITVHPLGGCGMGETAADGVVDSAGRVFDSSNDEKDSVHPGLYVLDGSIIPTSLAANPLLTITALAERAMMLLAEREGRELDVEPKSDRPLRDALM